MRVNLNNIILCFILLIFFSIHAKASDPVIITDTVDSYPLGTYFQYLEDKTTKLAFEEILTSNINGQFKKHEKKVVNFGKTRSVYWFKFTVINKMKKAEELLLESSWPLYDHITLYSESKPGIFIENKYGNVYPFDNREIKHRNFIFKIAPPLNREQTIYIRIKTETSMQAPFTVWKKNSFDVNIQKDMYFIGIFFGIILIMIFYNLFIFSTIKDFNYILLTFYFIIQCIFQMSYTGLLNQFVLTNHPLINIHSMPVSLGLVAIISLVFSRNFLNVKLFNPKLDLAYIVFIIILLICTFASIFKVYTPLKIINILGFFWVTFLIISSFFIFKKGYKPAKYFIYSWVFVLIAASILIPKNMGFLESNLFTNNSSMIGISFQVAFLSLALSERINSVKQDLLNHQIFALDVQTRMTNSFARFVPTEFLTFLNKKSIIDVELGNQIQKNMTVLFSDIRSFTDISEKMTPQENFNFLNSYLGRIGPIVKKNKGFIDKYIGDAVMALFPEEPENAIDTAIEIQRAIIEYNTHRKKENYPEIKIGIGIHTGNLMLGIIGEKNRMEGTVISDDVNLASRIENLTKYYEADIIISGRLFKQLKNSNQCEYRVIDKVTVKGKNKAITLIEILDNKSTKNYVIKIINKVKFTRALKLYWESKIAESLNLFTEILHSENGFDRVINIYIERCENLLKNGIPDGWNGIEKLDIK